MVTNMNLLNDIKILEETENDIYVSFIHYMFIEQSIEPKDRVFKDKDGFSTLQYKDKNLIPIK